MIIFKKDNILVKWNKRKDILTLYVNGILKGTHNNDELNIEQYLYREGFKVFMRSV